MTSWKYGVYHLLRICSAHIEVRIKWCLIPPFFFLNFIVSGEVHASAALLPGVTFPVIR